VSYSFATYDFFVYVIPGGVLLFFLIVMFPGVRQLFGQESMNVGALALFLVVAFSTGQLLQTLSQYVIQWPMEQRGWAYRTNDVLWTDQKVLGDSDRALLVEAVKRDFGFFPKDSLNFKNAGEAGDKADDLKTEWRRVIGGIYARVHPNRQSTDLLSSYSQHFSLNRENALVYLTIFIVLLVIFCQPRYQRSAIFSVRILRVPAWTQPILLALALIAFAVSVKRVSDFDKMFVEELFHLYLHPG